MSFFRPTLKQLLNRSCTRLSKRYLLSNAFECKEAWNQRLTTPVLRKINIENMYYDLDHQFGKSKLLAPIDIDIFVNAQKDDSYLTEVEEIVHRFRQTKNAHLLLPATHHAFIKLFMEYKSNDLVRILDDRLNYGIFPDDYLIVYLIDKFLKANDLRNAAKISSLPMLQEDYSHPMTKYLSLYTIHKYILSDILWEDKVEEKISNEEEEEEEEEIKVRVNYLRNPYFDDHFDLTDGEHICGKSLVMISSNLDNVALSNSYKIMGLALYNKWEKLENELNRLVQLQGESKDLIIYKDGLEFASKIVNEKLQNESSKITTLISEIKESSCNSNVLSSDLESIVKEVIKVHEPHMIQAQKQLIKDFEIMRENELQRHLEEVRKSQRIQDLQLKKRELQEKDQLLHFFENEDTIDLVCEEKQRKLNYRAKFQSLEDQDKAYIPPEVQKRVTEDD